MMPCNQRNIRISKPVKLPELPFDSISEILSWLPVECLLRFKCMCKQWCSLIKDYKFVLKHMERTSPMLLLYPCKSNDANFEFVSSSAGLCMEKSVSNSRVFRIRNPATHQVLYLPDVPPYTTTVDFAFNSFTGECKVLCVYWDKIRRNVDAKFGFKVLTIGNDEHWRLLEIPDQNKLRNKSVLQGCSTAVDKVEGVCHLLQTIRVTDNEEDLYMEIHSLDLWSECFITSTLHRGDFSDFNDVQFLLWNNCLTVGYATETSLGYFLVLEEYKERNWCKHRIIISLKISNEVLPVIKNQNRNRNDKVLTAEFDLHISGVNYNITYVGKMETSKSYCRSGTGEVLHKPSLMTLKGMIPENGLV